MIRFLCGCKAEISGTLHKDPDGFVVCQTHGRRRYGWRSLPTLANGRPDYSIAGMTWLEMEQYVLWDKIPPLKKMKLREPKQDRRDNRDPVQDNLEIMGDVYMDRAIKAEKHNNKPRPDVNGNEQMAFQRELAQSYLDAKK